MNYEDAKLLSLKVEWKTSFCSQGESCWCRIIEPLEDIILDDGSKHYIVGSGSLGVMESEYLVKIHNERVKLLHRLI